jgi:shikimate kinase
LNIILIGYRGSGKSTIGRMLAKKLSMEFADSDRLIENSTGKSIERIFSEEGEPAFRKYEEQEIRKLSGFDNHVISLGGGAVLNEKNVASFRGNSVIIYLEASPETLYERTKRSSRPRLTGEQSLYSEIEVLLEKRRPLYEKSCDFKVSTEKPFVLIVNEITEGISKLNKENKTK